MKKKIAIIGAGISGLTFANLLKKNPNFEFTLYEKNNSLSLVNGYGIQLAPNSVFILNKIGFSKIHKEEKYNPKKIDFYSIKNNKICELDIARFNSENIQYTTLKRSILVNCLKENLLSNDIQFNKKITKINLNNFKLEILFEDNSSDLVDYLIIADGVFSPTKSVLFNENIKPNYFGSVAIRGILTKEDLKFLNKENISVLLGPNFHLVTYPLNEKGEYNFIAIIKKKLNKKILEEHNFFNNKVNIKNLIEKKETLINFIDNVENFKCLPIFASEKIWQPNQKNIFFLGDALFSSPPSFAQGAAQSIESAYELYEILNADNKNNFNIYYNNRTKKIRMVDRRSKLNYFTFHLSNPLLVFCRNKMLKILVNNKKFLDKYLGKIYLKH